MSYNMHSSNQAVEYVYARGTEGNAYIQKIPGLDTLSSPSVYTSASETNSPPELSQANNKTIDELDIDALMEITESQSDQDSAVKSNSTSFVRQDLNGFSDGSMAGTPHQPNSAFVLHDQLDDPFGLDAAHDDLENHFVQNLRASVSHDFQSSSIHPTTPSPPMSYMNTPAMGYMRSPMQNNIASTPQLDWTDSHSVISASPVATPPSTSTFTSGMSSMINGNGTMIVTPVRNTIDSTGYSISTSGSCANRPAASTVFTAGNELRYTVTSLGSPVAHRESELMPIYTEQELADAFVQFHHSTPFVIQDKHTSLYEAVPQFSSQASSNIQTNDHIYASSQFGGHQAIENTYNSSNSSNFIDNSNTDHSPGSHNAARYGLTTNGSQEFNAQSITDQKQAVQYPTATQHAVSQPVAPQPAQTIAAQPGLTTQLPLPNGPITFNMPALAPPQQFNGKQTGEDTHHVDPQKNNTEAGEVQHTDAETAETQVSENKDDEEVLTQLKLPTAPIVVKMPPMWVANRSGNGSNGRWVPCTIDYTTIGDLLPLPAKIDPTMFILERVANKSAEDVRLYIQGRLLIHYKDVEGLKFKDIEPLIHTGRAEATLRGRYRTATKEKKFRPRKPQWLDEDVEKLCEVVGEQLDRINKIHPTKSLMAKLSKVQWLTAAKDVRDQTHHAFMFGPGAAKKKYLQVIGLAPVEGAAPKPQTTGAQQPSTQGQKLSLLRE